MGFLPFVRRDGQWVVRWPRLVLAWAFLMAGALLGSCAAGYALTGDWRQFDAGVWMSVLGCASLTVYGLTTPVQNLPALRPTPPAEPDSVG